MRRCKKCKVPLEGLLSLIGKAFFNIKPSKDYPELCNKCARDIKILEAEKGAYIQKGGKYRCQICKRMIHEHQALEHIKAEEYLINLIKKDHPQWEHQEPTCAECVSYYRRLVNEAEI